MTPGSVFQVRKILVPTAAAPPSACHELSGPLEYADADRQGRVVRRRRQ